MITWPIYIALILSITAVYFSIKTEDDKIKKEREEKEKKEHKRLDLIKRKQRIENEIQHD